MKKNLILAVAVILIAAGSTFAQSNQTTKSSSSNSIHEYNTNHEWIFDANVTVTECDAVGTPSSNKVTALQGYTFNIKAVDSKDGDIVIVFTPFKDVFSDLKSKFNSNKYFLLTKADFALSCSDNTDASKWAISYGALVIPFKFRPTKSIFTNNTNLGSSVYFQYALSKDWAHGVVLGVSLSSVTLDSLSTNYKIKTNTDRPAFTPSLSYVISYKNISFTAGLGTDIISKTSVVEKSWIFNGKPWIGFGLGINLFTQGNTASKTETSDKQSKDKTPN